MVRLSRAVSPLTTNHQSLIPDTKLIVDGKEFHRNCFTCSACSALLDSVYGRKEGQYYCETCYVQMFGKKCSDCGLVILGSGLKFSSDHYHTQCFKCWQCGAGLSQGAHTIKDRPVCADCYDKHFQESCTVCHQTVSQGIIFKEKRFHPQCFKCLRCGLLLEDKKGEFLLTEAGLQCKKCVVSNMSVVRF